MNSISLVFQLVNIIPKVRAALASGGNVLDIVQRLAPDVLPIIQDYVAQTFPAVDPTKAIQAGIDTIFDEDGSSWVQNNLNALGQTPALVVDGRYGKNTKAAVTAYQVKKGLKADGWAGPKTSGAIAVDVANLPVKP